MQNQSPLNFLLKEMCDVHNAGHFYAAIALSLMLPDICSKLTFEPSEDAYWSKTHKRYQDWCSKYLTKHLQILTAEDVWALRGGVIHQGQSFGHPNARFQRVVFILPDGRGNKFSITSHRAENSKPVKSISTEIFCKAFLDAVNEFIEATKENAVVQKNIVGLVRLRPNGYEDHIVGIPCIA
jgi:hypothetical protein